MIRSDAEELGDQRVGCCGHFYVSGAGSRGVGAHVVGEVAGFAVVVRDGIWVCIRDGGLSR